MATSADNGAGLRVVFMGTPAFAVPALDALLQVGCEITGVYTKPDRRSGRGRRLTAPPVKQAAIERGLSVFQPASLRRDAEARAQLAALQPDVIVVVAYGLFLPADTLAVPPLGALNLHPSLLPKYRGPSPVASAILNGDTTTGVTLMRLDEGMDSGPIIAQRDTQIGAEETTADLTPRLFKIGAQLLAECLPQCRDGAANAMPQREADATITRLLTREDGAIDWTNSADYIARQVRAYHPWPGSFTRWNGRQLKVHQATAIGIGAFEELGDESFERQEPGEVVENPQGIAVVCGDDLLLLLRLQIEGRQATDIDDFVRGYRDFPGSRLGST
ncbi:MAG: methionyl-tRNA formyltransferase [Chloroflexi bacterium]|nr:methionyl-tRNA formyltransferase [Chloroflexota bacterium]